MSTYTLTLFSICIVTEDQPDYDPTTPISSHPIPFSSHSHLISSLPISSHFFLSHLFSSYLVSSLPIPTPGLTQNPKLKPTFETHHHKSDYVGGAAGHIGARTHSDNDVTSPSRRRFFRLGVGQRRKEELARGVGKGRVEQGFES
jgi:hypothetical protein